MHTVRKSLLSFVASMTLVALLAQGAWAGDQDFTLVNKTGVEIHRMYTSPHDTDDWEEDVLGVDTLPDGESVDITFSPKEAAEMWDLKVEDEEGNSLTWENLNLLEISTVTLFYKKGKGWAETE